MTSSTDKKSSLKDVLLTSGLAVALVVNGFQFWQNRELQERMVRIEKVSKFRVSGSELDRAVIDVFDALAEGALSSSEAEEFRGAYVDHVVATEAEREFLGADETDSYLQALNILEDEIDLANGPRGAGTRVEALARVIQMRRQISEQSLEM